MNKHKQTQTYTQTQANKHNQIETNKQIAINKQTLAGNYLQQTPIRIWKRYIPLLIDLLISNNFSSMTLFCTTRILRVGRQSVRQSTDFFTDFLA